MGDATLEELTVELEKALGDWRSAEARVETKFPPLSAPKPTTLYLIDKPGAPQSVVSVALPGTMRTSPDYFRLLVMNSVFGGQFSSRLNLNLREQKGYTYGAKSMFEWRVHDPGLFVATASVQTAVTAPAVAEFLKELDGMVGGRPITTGEVEFCRRYITRGYPSLFETPTQVAGQLETLFTYRLPDDYFNTVLPGIDAVTLDDVSATAKKYLKVGELKLVVVGDRSKIEAGLRAAARRPGVGGPPLRRGLSLDAGGEVTNLGRLRGKVISQAAELRETLVP